jgi:hypothetical protein
MLVDQPPSPTAKGDAVMAPVALWPQRTMGTGDELFCRAATTTVRFVRPRGMPARARALSDPAKATSRSARPPDGAHSVAEAPQGMHLKGARAHWQVPGAQHAHCREEALLVHGHPEVLMVNASAEWSFFFVRVAG